MLRVRAIKIDNSVEAKREIERIGADAGGINVMIPKAVHRVIRIENLSSKAAVILKQEMLSKGGEAALSRGVGNFSVDKTDVLLMGTVKQFYRVISKLRAQPFGLRKLAEVLTETIKNLDKSKRSGLDCRGYDLPLGERTLVMGSLSITSDSFSDDGKCVDLDDVVRRAQEMVKQGADIIEIGGEPTRLTPTPVTVEQELERVLPVLRRLVKEIDVPVSVDTYKAETARQALEEGAHIINDKSGLKEDYEMAGVVAKYDNVPVIITHNQQHFQYNSIMDDILDWLRERVNIALEAGIRKENIILDPGIGLGFGKDMDQSLEVLQRLWEFKTLGYPLLLGTSRNSVTGEVPGLPVDERIEATAAALCYGITQGVDIVKVHDIKEMVRTVKMTDAIVRR